MNRLLSLLALLALGGCYRSPTKEVVLLLPDLQTGEQVGVVKEWMREQDRADGTQSYESIRVISDPPSLHVVYNPRHLADRNVEASVTEFGLRVNDLPGNPDRRDGVLSRIASDTRP